MIIIINGSASAGKTSIIKFMQTLYTKPLVHAGIDRFWAMIPDQYKECGAKAEEGYLFSQTFDNQNNPSVQIERGPFAQQFDYTMPRIIKCLADHGHDVVADTIITDDAQICNYAKTLHEHTVYFVGIVCDLEELEKREKERGNRILGLARGQINCIHKHENYYDLIIDSTDCDQTTSAQKILDFIKETPAPQGFKMVTKKPL